MTWESTVLELVDNGLEQKGLWLIVSQGKIVVSQGEATLPFLRWSALRIIHHYKDQIRQLNAPDLPLEHPLFVVDLGAEVIDQPGWACIDFRQLLLSETRVAYEALARTWQLMHFMRTHRFCGQCGSPMHAVDWEMATQCQQCNHRCYPRVSPCTIVAIYRGKEILLARSVRHRNSDMFSIIAGFVESGESVEQATHREVMEEVGIRVKNLEYFGSQAWPFPHSLMMGYFAEYDSGEIVIDERELLEADWYHVDNLPVTPPTLSIAGKMVNELAARLSQRNDS